MADLGVVYMGLALSNPIVVSSSSLTNTPEKVKACADAGAGAVVLKSLFEEEIEAEIEASAGGTDHTEALDYIRSLQTGDGLKRYTRLIREAKQAASIPVIASINAASSDWWEEHVPALAAAGADAIELNISLMPYDYKASEDGILHFYTSTVEAVSKLVSVPIAVKIGHYFTSIPAIVDRLGWAGARSVVLFNRFFQLDIDIEKLSLTSGSPLSTQADLAFPLRWISMLYGKTEVELAASSGVHSGTDIVKVLLAGAQVAQVCSALYRNRLDAIAPMLDDLRGWMERHSYFTIDQFRGRMSQKHSDAPERFERLQYIKALVGHE